MSLKIALQFFLFFSFSCFYGKAQQVDTIWLNSKWEKSTKAESAYYRVIEKSSNLKLYLVSDYYNSGELQMRGTYSSLNPEIREGQFKWWYKNGKKRAEIFYKDQNVIKEIEWDTEGKITVQHEIVNVSNLVDGKRENTKAYLDAAPEFEGGMAAVHKFIGENFRYPESLENDKPHGKIIVNFAVNNNGKVVDVKIEQGLDKLLDQEAVRVIKSLPAWRPGIQNGKPVNIRMSLPLSF